jgi:hypothetical protein
MVEVGAMEATGNIGNGNERHQCFVIAKLIKAERLAHIAID